MKLKLLVFIYFSFFLTKSNDAYAAFVSGTRSNTVNFASTTAPANVFAETDKETRIPKYKAIKLLMQDEKWHPKKHSASKTGWEGIASFVLAIRGILMFPPAFIAAIVLGAMGMGKGAKHRGMAIAGLTIGLLGAFFWGFLLAMAVM